MDIGNCKTSSAISFLLKKKIKVPLISGLQPLKLLFSQILTHIQHFWQSQKSAKADRAFLRGACRQ